MRVRTDGGEKDGRAGRDVGEEDRMLFEGRGVKQKRPGRRIAQMF